MKSKLEIELLDQGPLSRREAQVLCHWLSGEPHKILADRLFISVKTLETHIEHIKVKLQTRNQLVALKAAEERGLVRCRLVKFLCVVLCCSFTFNDQSVLRSRIRVHGRTVVASARVRDAVG